TAPNDVRDHPGDHAVVDVAVEMLVEALEPLQGHARDDARSLPLVRQRRAGQQHAGRQTGEDGRGPMSFDHDGSPRARQHPLPFLFWKRQLGAFETLSRPASSSAKGGGPATAAAPRMRPVAVARGRSIGYIRSSRFWGAIGGTFLRGARTPTRKEPSNSGPFRFVRAAGEAGARCTSG